MNLRLNDAWRSLLEDEFNQPYFEQLVQFVKAEYESGSCYPKGSLIFNAFDQCAPNDVKVIILGQDPYINPGQAQGLAFSVPEESQYPPSLRNIYKEIESDLSRPSSTKGDLTPWAKQGVLLLNSSLTVRAGLSGSHQGKGWERFTDRVIECMGNGDRPRAFLLWGSHAQRKATLINQSTNLVLEAPHPSPLSAHRGFFGCKHFSMTNAWLNANKLQQIDW
jgi:uracil-DNA glycosylase